MQDPVAAGSKPYPTFTGSIPTTAKVVSIASGCAFVKQIIIENHGEPA